MHSHGFSCKINPPIRIQIGDYLFFLRELISVVASTVKHPLVQEWVALTGDRALGLKFIMP